MSRKKFLKKFKNNLKKLLTRHLKTPIIFILIERETTEIGRNSQTGDR